MNRPNGRLTSGGLPFHPQNRLPLARDDLQSRAEKCQDAFCLDKDEARTEPKHYNTGPPGLRIRLPVTGANCRGLSAIFLVESNPHTRGICHPDAVLTAEGSDKLRNCAILGPDESGLRMTYGTGWSPPGRNGPPEAQECDTRQRITNRASPRSGHKRARESIQVTLCSRRWLKEDRKCDAGFHGSGPPQKGNRHPERSRLLTNEGSAQRGICQILRPDESGLRMTHGLGWMVTANNSYSADENQISVLELCEEKKFSRSENFGTPSFSLIAHQTDDLFTIDTFS
jgi:hypothetical protein